MSPPGSNSGVPVVVSYGTDNKLCVTEALWMTDLCGTPFYVSWKLITNDYNQNF